MKKTNNVVEQLPIRPMPKFPELKSKMGRLNIRQIDLARATLLDATGISLRMSGKYPWRLGEVYKVMELIGEPLERIPFFFPEDVVAAKAK